jgi:Right handed beta helix region
VGVEEKGRRSLAEFRVDPRVSTFTRSAWSRRCLVLVALAGAAIQAGCTGTISQATDESQRDDSNGDDSRSGAGTQVGAESDPSEAQSGTVPGPGLTGQETQPSSGASNQAGKPPQRDAGSDQTGSDAGPSNGDAGQPARDAGTTARDAGQVGLDSGQVVDAGSPPPGPSGPGTADGVWSRLTVMSVVNPLDYGAQGNGTSDDLGALSAAVNALPAAGGIVYLPSGRTFKKTNVLVVTKSHVKFWSPNRQAEVFQSLAGVRRRQALLCRGNTGCGFFGLKLRSDATVRFDAPEDDQISADNSTLLEVVGCELQGSAAAGISLHGSTEHYLEGNYIHHTWADHIHHTAAAKASWVWNNYIFNELPSKGDDGVACVTYGPSAARCADMEWWRNTILHTDWGRGFSVIGGNAISIHDNWAIGVAGAGIIVASESSYNSASSQGITIANNYVYGCGHTIGHPGILVSGMSSAAGPLQDIALTNNVSVGAAGGAYRAEGSYTNVTNVNMASATTALPAPMPSTGNVRMADTSVLRTRDVSHVAEGMRAGLYRIHVRAAGSGFEQRFEYMVKGAADAMKGFLTARASAGDYVSEQRVVDGTTYALVLCAAPVALPSGLSAVTFRELRTKDQSGALSWLWNRVDAANY